MSSDAASRMAWVRDHMPMLAAIRHEFEQSEPFSGLTIAARIHIEPKTAVLHETLAAGGARIVATGNYATTQDDIADYLRGTGIEVLGARADDDDAMRSHIAELAAAEPDLVLDNGAELIEHITRAAAHIPRGATEETTSGANRLTEQLGSSVGFPVIVINDSPLKSIVENKHGVGESIVDVIQRATNLMLHRKQFVVFGYGWCGRGIALYARNRGARVTVVEPDAVKALEAAFDGFQVDPADQAIEGADVIVTATGRDGIVGTELIAALRSGVILANAGHDPREIDVRHLEELAQERTEVTPTVTTYALADGRNVTVLAGGAMLNLAAAEGGGNPVETMDLGFALQARSLQLLSSEPSDLPNGRTPVPAAINDTVAHAMTDEMMGRNEPQRKKARSSRTM